MKRMVPCLVVLLAVVQGWGPVAQFDDSATVKANGNKASLTSQRGAWLIASEP